MISIDDGARVECPDCGRVDCDEWVCTAGRGDEVSKEGFAKYYEKWERMYGTQSASAATVQSTIDEAVAATRANKEHMWATQPASGEEASYDYCSRCGRMRDDLKVEIAGETIYLPCRGFVG